MKEEAKLQKIFGEKDKNVNNSNYDSLNTISLNSYSNYSHNSNEILQQTISNWNTTHHKKMKRSLLTNNSISNSIENYLPQYEYMLVQKIKPSRDILLKNNNVVVNGNGMKGTQNSFMKMEIDDNTNERKNFIKNYNNNYYSEKEINEYKKAYLNSKFLREKEKYLSQSIFYNNGYDICHCNENERK